MHSNADRAGTEHTCSLIVGVVLSVQWEFVHAVNDNGSGHTADSEKPRNGRCKVGRVVTHGIRVHDKHYNIATTRVSCPFTPILSLTANVPATRTATVTKRPTNEATVTARGFMPHQHFMLTPPRFTRFTFKPIVGQVSKGCPSANTFSRVVLPLRDSHATHHTQTQLHGFTPQHEPIRPWLCRNTIFTRTNFPIQPGQLPFPWRRMLQTASQKCHPFSVHLCTTSPRFGDPIRLCPNFGANSSLFLVNCSDIRDYVATVRS